MPPKTESTDTSHFRGNCKFSKTSLRQQTGYLKNYKDKHGSTLPNILISSPIGRKLRFLIDTGASNSFIDPKFVPLQQRESLSTNTVIKSVLKEIQVTEKVEYPAFSEFNLKDTFIF